MQNNSENTMDERRTTLRLKVDDTVYADDIFALMGEKVEPPEFIETLRSYEPWRLRDGVELVVL